MKTKRLTLFTLAWPLFIEFLLLMTLGFVDTYMLSTYNDLAAGAVGTATKLTSFFNMILFIAAGGSGVLISQYIGAKQDKDAEQTIVISLYMNLVAGLIISLGVFIFGDYLLQMINVSEDLMPFASKYMKIVGSFLFIQALMNAMSVAIKSHGKTKVVMFISLFMNILNVLGDAVFIFGLFGVPILGVKGIALATVVSRSLALIVMALYLFTRIITPASLMHNFVNSLAIAKKILKIGLPAAAEVLSFNLIGIVSTTLIFIYVGQDAVIANTYAGKIILISMVFSYAIGNATQIMIGRLVGEKKVEEAFTVTMKNFYIAFVLSSIAGLVLIIFGRNIIEIFTDNHYIITIAVMAVFIDGFLEPGRAFNHVFVYALRGAGDVVFPVVVGLIMGWGLRIGLGCVFAINLGMGYPGFILGALIDEWLRGIIMMLRWRSRKWQSKRVI